MTDAADLVLLDGDVHTLAEPDETREAVAIRDGRIVRVDSTYEIEHLAGVETEVIDCEGRVVLPGFVDAHTHMESQGLYLVHADLSGAADIDDAIDALSAQADTDREWVLGFGYDESAWPETRYPTREDLDAVSEERPVVAMRVDMHTASLNSVALDRLVDEMPDHDVETEDGEPTGVVVEDATEAVWNAVEADYDQARELVTAAIDHANSLGVTCVHDKVRQSHAPRVYRDLELEGELDCRVRIDYWSDHLESVIDAGLATNAGSEFVRTGAIKSFTDGSLGARTAKLFEPYDDLPADAESDDVSTEGADEGDAVADGGAAETPDADAAGDGRGQWVVDPDELAEVAETAAAHDYQLTVHAIGDEAVHETIGVLAETENADSARHRIEHAELATDEHLERMAEAGIVASVQPNFHQWARPGGLYDQRLGEERRKRTNRLRTILDAGVPLAFGSDCMPLDPLLGVHHAVTAPEQSQRLSVTEALRAYTLGAAYAGFDEDRMGTVEVGKCADVVILEESPWENEDRIHEIDVATTIVDGEVVYDVGE
ncbi:amidohydrolase [Halovivax sp.]|uniref:amidohydrolase n=1 Tax=Halovivax sp. TaxID=1935978 RepID=UPI0025C177EA|nr:amidohydrolase [Halovivax sp.]